MNNTNESKQINASEQSKHAYPTLQGRSYTPGPWASNGGYIGSADIASEKECIFNGSENAICVMARVNGQQKEVDYANARLICAAPEMLEMLERMASFMQKNIDDNTAESQEYEELTADYLELIAKAKGSN